MRLNCCQDKGGTRQGDVPRLLTFPTQHSTGTFATVLVAGSAAALLLPGMAPTDAAWGLDHKCSTHRPLLRCFWLAAESQCPCFC